MAKYRPGVWAARLLLDRYQLRAPVDVELLVVQIFQVPLYRTPLPDRISGELVFNEGHPSIVVNSKHALVRQRFTIAHEVIHLVCGHGPALCLEKADSSKEREANAGAAELLMPESYVRMHAIHYDYDIERLARRYNVSQQAMEIRLRDLGVLGDSRADKPGGVWGLLS